MSPDEAGLVAFVQANPDDTTARAALADWLDEHDRPLDAAKQRDAAGISEVYYKLRRKSDGLFSEGREQSRGTGIDITYRWSTKGKSWRRLEDLRAHLAALRPWNRAYGGRGKAGTPWTDLEVVVVECGRWRWLISRSRSGSPDRIAGPSRSSSGNLRAEPRSF